MADGVQVKFGANITDLVEGINSAVGELRSFAEAVGAMYVADKTAEFIAQFGDMGEKIERATAIFGASTKDVQELQLANELAGGSAESFGALVDRLQQSLQRAQVPTSQQALALKAIGLSASQLIGVPLPEQFDRIADAVSKFADGGNKTAIVMALLGRGGAEMIPTLDLGRAGLDQMRQSAEDAGTVMSKGTVAALSETSHALTTMSASFSALGGTIVGEMAPAFEGLVKVIIDFFAVSMRSITEGGLLKATLDALAAAIGAIDIALAVSVGALETFWELVKTVTFETAEAFKGLGRIMFDVFTFRWSDVSAAWNDFAAKSQARARIMAADMETIVKNMVSEIKTTISGAGEGVSGKGPLPQAPALNTNIAEQTSELQSHYQTMIKQIDDFYSLQKQQLSADYNQHKITYDQETAALLQALDARHAGEDAAYDAEIAAMKAAGKNYEAVVKAKTAADDKWRREHEKIVQEAVAHEQKQWETGLSAITSAFNSNIKGLIEGTTTWSQAFKNTLEDLLIKFIEMCEEMLVKWVAAQAAQTTAATAGAATRTAVETSASSAGILANAAKAIEAIMQDAAQTFAGVFAFLAPTMGPAAAGPAAAAQASVSAAAIFDLGTNYVVRGGLALIHPGETIIPAAKGSGPYTGTGIGAQVHAPVSINVAALDAQSVRRFFNDNSSHMLRAINDAVKRGAHLGLRAANR
ncbi:MAG: hypothetical protein WBF58_21920 [Xanthobacteraceae bacterium]